MTKPRHDLSQTSLPRSSAQPISDNPSRATGFGSTQLLKITEKLQKLFHYIVTPPLVMYTNTFAVTDEAKNFISDNQKRRYLLIQNNGSVDVWVSWGGTANLNLGVKLQPNAVWTFDGGYCGSNTASFWCASSALVSVTEGITRNG